MSNKMYTWSGRVSSVRASLRGFFAGQHRGVTGTVVRKSLCSASMRAIPEGCRREITS